MSIYTQGPDTHYKDPQAKLDYHWDWASPDAEGGPYLEPGETIASAVVTVPAGIARPAGHTTDIVTPTSVSVWLEGGVLSATYRVTCHVVTSAGREDERTKLIVIRNK